VSIKRAKEVVEAAKRHDHFMMMEDGYQWFCPDAGMAFDAFSLRAIADGLDRMNKRWDDVVKKDIPALSEALRKSRDRDK
jgi:hypothetical protein